MEIPLKAMIHAPKNRKDDNILQHTYHKLISTNRPTIPCSTAGRRTCQITKT